VLGKTISHSKRIQRLLRVPMTDNKKAEFYLEVAKMHMDHLRQTRDIEFKVNLALWTGIVLAGYFLYGEVPLDDHHSRLLYGLMASLILFGHVVCWMMPVQHSQDRDNDFLKKYQKLAVGHISIPPVKGLWRVIAWLRKDGWSWVLFEGGFTFILLFVVGVFLASTGTAQQSPVPLTQLQAHKWFQTGSIALALAGTYILAFGLWVKEGISKEPRKALRTDKTNLIVPSDVRQRTPSVVIGLVLITIAAGIQLYITLF